MYRDVRYMGVEADMDTICCASNPLTLADSSAKPPNISSQDRP
jgi:hypothetical protein